MTARPGFCRGPSAATASRFLPRACACVIAGVVCAVCVACSPLRDDAPAAPRYLIDERQFTRERLDILDARAPVPAPVPARVRPESFEERVTILPGVAPRAATASAPMVLRAGGLPLPVFARMLSRASGYNVVADAGGEATLDLHLDGVAWRDALATVAGMHGLVAHERASARLIALRAGGDGARAGAARAEEPGQVEMFRLRFARPAEVKPLLEALFERQGGKSGKGGKGAVVVSDERSQAVIVRGGRRDVALAASLIRELDTRHQQVLIEAFIVEAGEDFQRNLGARLARDAAPGRPPRVYGAAGGADDGLFVNLPAAGAATGLGLRFGKSRIRLELTALENEGKSRIISNPRVFTLDNRQAVIFQGDEIPYQTVSQDGTRTEFKQAGLRLAVTPSVIDDDHLLLDVEINKDTVDVRVPNPPITRREIASRLLVADGDMVVIGGIRLDTRVDAQGRVPVAGELPVVGGLFRNTRARRDVRELMVFILPEIVR